MLPLGDGFYLIAFGFEPIGYPNALFRRVSLDLLSLAVFVFVFYQPHKSSPFGRSAIVVGEPSFSHNALPLLLLDFDLFLEFFICLAIAVATYVTVLATLAFQTYALGFSRI